MWGPRYATTCWLGVLLLALAVCTNAKDISYESVTGAARCSADFELYPSSTVEVAKALVLLYQQTTSDMTVKVKAVTKVFGSTSSFECPQLRRPGSSSSSSKALTVAVFMEKMTKVLEVDSKAGTMRVQAQITYKDLFKAATAAGLSVKAGTTGFWQGLTLAGSIAVGAHGTGLNMESSICDMVEEITFVDGTGTINTVKRESAVARGVCSGNGLLGIMTEVKLQLQPTTILTIQTKPLLPDALLPAAVDKLLAEGSPRLNIFWRPDVKSWTYHRLTEAPFAAGKLPASFMPDAYGTLMPMVPDRRLSLGGLATAAFGAALAKWQADVDNKDPFTPVFEKSLYPVGVSTLISPWAKKTIKETPLADLQFPLSTLPAYELTGFTNKVAASDCGDSCVFVDKDLQYAYLDWEFTLPKSRLDEWINDVKKVWAMDLQQKGPHFMALFYYWFRFGQTSTDYLSTAYGVEEPVFIEQAVNWAKATADVALPKYSWVFDVMEQVSICKYGARPHWGKNYDRTFTHPKCSTRDMYPSFNHMLKLQDEYDPKRFFEGELMGRLINGSSIAPYPRCTLHHACYCSEDIHCPQGMRCVPSNAFPEFLVCKPPSMI